VLLASATRRIASSASEIAASSSVRSPCSFNFTVGLGFEDLAAHGIVTRESGFDGQPLWQLSDWTWSHLEQVGLSADAPS
jgi:hypothetical protein